MVVVAATVGVACCDGESEGSAQSRGEAASPWDYLDAEYPSEMRERRMSDARLRQYMDGVAGRLGQLVAKLEAATSQPERAQLQRLLEEIKKKIELSTQKIVYGVSEPNARRAYVEGYGCARWTEEALQVLGSQQPLIEIGAGHWQRQLALRGVDIVAFDNGATLQPTQKTVGNVQPGDERMISAHPERTLFLCYPPDTSMALKCLRLYRGDRLVYVGEGRGGVNATPEFFDSLDNEWDVVAVHELDPFPRCYERMFVLKRRARSWSSYLWGGKLR